MDPAAPDEGGHGGVGSDGVLDHVAERLPGELVDDVEDLDDPPGGGDVELVVEGPHVVGMDGGQAVGERGRGAEALALAVLGRDPQALFTPDAGPSCG